MRIRRQRLKKVQLKPAIKDLTFLAAVQAAAIQAQPEIADEIIHDEPPEGPLQPLVPAKLQVLPPEEIGAPFAYPEVGAYAALEKFNEGIELQSTLLSKVTGTPVYLYGDLLEAQDDDSLSVAETFISQEENLKMLAGNSKGFELRRIRETHWDDGSCQIVFAQTNLEGVPIYGGNIVCNLTPEGTLTHVSNALYPLEQSNLLEWGDPPSVQEDFRVVGRWILPYQSQDEKGSYRPVWQVLDLERGESSMLDAQTGKTLYTESMRAGLTIQAKGYLNTTGALNDPLNDGEGEPLLLDFGHGAAKLVDAKRVHIEDTPRRIEPSGNSDEEAYFRKLTATVFYHVFLAQAEFKERLGLWITSLFSSLLGYEHDPLDDINVRLADGNGTAYYDFGTNTIVLNGEKKPPFAIKEPGFDCEVIYHEFTHAVLRFLNPEFFQYPNSDQTSTQALDEGLAFYYACVLGKNGKWAEYAYQDWGDTWNFERVPIKINDIQSPGPTGKWYYRYAAWWACLLWQIRTDPQTNAEKFDKLVSKGFKSLSASYPLNQLDAAKTFGVALLNHADGQAEKGCIRSKFGLAGVEL